MLVTEHSSIGAMNNRLFVLLNLVDLGLRQGDYPSVYRESVYRGLTPRLSLVDLCAIILEWTQLSCMNRRPLFCKPSMCIFSAAVISSSFTRLLSTTRASIWRSIKHVSLSGRVSRRQPWILLQASCKVTFALQLPHQSRTIDESS